MQRRKYLAGLGALAAGSGAAVGTGAFTSVTADRGVSVAVADDADALLAIEPEDTPNGNEYADVSGGEVLLDFSNTNETFAESSDDGASGINGDADTTIRDVLQVTNQGTQDVIVGIGSLPSATSAYTDDGDVAANGNSTSLNWDNYSPSSGNLALVEPGETMNRVGFIFRDPPNSLNLTGGTLTLNAVAVDSLADPAAVRSNYSNVTNNS
ncbi:MULTISPECIES: hypothetical protein [unclassified Halorubrum]|uniref:hypothetical protein n=1 Tax=unclassified Halorubrum TaxID=2642239 RepID=UPI0011C47C8C|nr:MULTISPECIES: hypothetical protein [unclassified Halorubrum]